MKFGMNLLLWTGELNDDLMGVLESLKSMGYDGVEVPIFNLELDYAAWGKKLDDIGLERTAVTVRTEDDNPISPQSAVRQKGVDLTKKTLDCCAAIGATHLVGPYHSALGVFSGKGRTEDEWKWGVESMRAVAEHAGSVNVTLGVECLNRFETYLLNTHADSAKFAREVNHPNCKMMYDTFHANIEPRPHQRERPQHARGGERPLGRKLGHAQGGRLRRLADDRSVRPGSAGTGGRHENLAADV